MAHNHPPSPHTTHNPQTDTTKSSPPHTHTTPLPPLPNTHRDYSLGIPVERVTSRGRDLICIHAVASPCRLSASWGVAIDSRSGLKKKKDIILLNLYIHKLNIKGKSCLSSSTFFYFDFCCCSLFLTYFFLSSSSVSASSSLERSQIPRFRD